MGLSHHTPASGAENMRCTRSSVATARERAQNERAAPEEILAPKPSRVQKSRNTTIRRGVATRNGDVAESEQLAAGQARTRKRSRPVAERPEPEPESRHRVQEAAYPVIPRTQTRSQKRKRAAIPEDPENEDEPAIDPATTKRTTKRIRLADADGDHHMSDVHVPAINPQNRPEATQGHHILRSRQVPAVPAQAPVDVTTRKVAVRRNEKGRKKRARPNQ